ncbi:FprA family A-type flavoprotein [Candidatus Dependentiae bacterium]|nr:FprA family A-type flavoprotein [Candidatus Dependentiae bacterium]
MNAIKIKENIYWVGGIDWDLRNFHGYLTQRGSTYNAYLIIDEKIVLIDTVKHYLKDELLKRISSVIDPSKIDYIISNHVEMDHSGAIPSVKEIAKGAKIITSPNGLKGLKAHYKNDYDFVVVKSGDKLNIGKRELQFVLTPMVHWPDNMLTYLPEEKILFSNDAFGQHIASSERFDNEYRLDIIMEEAKKYYANIVLPYGQQVQSALKTAGSLKIDVIAPSHGIIWRNNISEIISSYQKWSGNETENRALIIYDTMWGSTKKIAFAIQDKFEEKGIKADMFNLQFNHISDIMSELLTAKYICVGSPTLNNNILPTISGFLTYLKGLSPKNRIGLAFGSFGWGGQSVGIIEEQLKLCGFDIIPSIKVQYIPDDEYLSQIKLF